MSNPIHIRITQNEHYTFSDILEYIDDKFVAYFIVQEDADEDVNRTHIHITAMSRIKYQPFMRDYFKIKFPLLEGKTDFGGHDIKDLDANDRYCCKGLKPVPREGVCYNDPFPFKLLAAQGTRYDNREHLWESHFAYWEQNQKLLHSDNKNKKQNKKKKSWLKDLGERLKTDNPQIKWELSTHCKMVVYTAMMQEMSSDAKKLGSKNFREMHRGIMNYLCPLDCQRDELWLSEVFPEEDLDTLLRFF